MTHPPEFELLELAAPYALHAISDHEQLVIDEQLAAAPATVAAAFYSEVWSIRETMSAVSASTAVEPPAHLRARVLTIIDQPKRRSRWQTALLAAAAAVIIGLGAVAVLLALRPAPGPTTAERVFAASDVHTVSGAIPGGGTATVIFSRERNAGVLVMNDVAPPQAGTVYQMWLINDLGPTSAGTMDEKAVAPSTTAMLPDLRHSDALAFTLEPGSGSERPTTPVLAKLPLTT